jgi:copper resistance protein C
LEIIMRLFTAFALAVLGAAAASSAGMAEPRLVSSTPTAKATVAKPTRLALTFSEEIMPMLSGIELTMTGMPGMANHQAMPIKGFKAQVSGKTILVTLPRALPAGTYDLKWHAAGADQHGVESSYSFTVR